MGQTADLDRGEDRRKGGLEGRLDAPGVEVAAVGADFVKVQDTELDFFVGYGELLL